MSFNSLNRDIQRTSKPIRSHLSAGVSGFFSTATSPQHKLGDPGLLASGVSSM